MFKHDDNTLIKKALGGSQRAWTRLVRRHEKQVYQHALRLCGDPEDALELMQEIFLAVFRNLPSFHHRSSFSTWLYRVSANRTIDFLRRRRPETLDRSGMDITSGERPEDVLAGNQQVLMLLQRLKPEDRWLVEQKLYQGWTFADLARQTGENINTLKARYYKALDIMRTCHKESPHDLADSL
jgi:RNA polymerase sigma-70 factor (ECF subfamily)